MWVCHCENVCVLGSPLYPQDGTTNLHLDISSAVNVMVRVVNHIVNNTTSVTIISRRPFTRICKFSSSLFPYYDTENQYYKVSQLIPIPFTESVNL